MNKTETVAIQQSIVNIFQKITQIQDDLAEITQKMYDLEQKLDSHTNSLKGTGVHEY